MTKVVRQSKRVTGTPIDQEEVRRIVKDVLEETGVMKATASLEAVAKAAATSAVKETLMTLGIDMKEPIETQRTFHALREMVELFNDKDFRDDLTHVRSARKASGAVKERGLSAIVGAVAAALFTLLVVGAREFFKAGGS